MAVQVQVAILVTLEDQVFDESHGGSEYAVGSAVRDVLSADQLLQASEVMATITQVNRY